MYLLVTLFVCILIFLRVNTRRNVLFEGVSVRNDEYQETTAEYIHELRSRAHDLVNNLRVDPGPFAGDPAGLRRLLNWNGIVHELDADPGERVLAYNQNKGEKIAVCAKHDAEFNKINEGVFVLLHELAHVMTVEYAHDAQFWDYFERLLRYAAEKGLYVPKNYSQSPETFCGERLVHNPMFD